LNPHTLFLCFEAQRTFAALHLVLPMPQKLLNPVKEWWRHGAETRERHYHIFNHPKQSKREDDMRLKLEKGLELFFQKKSEANYHSSFSCVFCTSPLLLTLKEHL
jgi:hypothetical protein